MTNDPTTKTTPPSEIIDYSSSPDDDDATRTHKRRERLEQNRISARESRKRKKNMIEELQRTVIALSRENKELNERNEKLRKELVDLGTKNPGVVRYIFSCYWRGVYEVHVMCTINILLCVTGVP